MKNDAVSLRDLTKLELIEIINKHIFEVSQSELAWIIYRRRRNYYLDEIEKATKEADKWAKINTVKSNKEWLAAQGRWNKAADKLKENEAWYDRKVKGD
jgi:hypothetical protein